MSVSQNLTNLGGGGGGKVTPIKRQGWKGERIGVNCVAWEGEFQHWLSERKEFIISSRGNLL